MSTYDCTGMVKGVPLHVRETLPEALNTWLYPFLLPLSPVVAPKLSHVNNNQSGKKLDLDEKGLAVVFI